MKLLVDNREPKDMINILKSRIKNIEQTNLDIGDFIIKNESAVNSLLIIDKYYTQQVSAVHVIHCGGEPSPTSCCKLYHLHA